MEMFGKLPYLRIICNYSDDCNFRCRWCHHEGVYSNSERMVLSPEQITSIAETFYKIGVRKFKILGGEPTLRKDLSLIIQGIRSLSPEIDISIVTNGHRLKDNLEEYKDAGLTRVNISLFTLDEEYFCRNIGDIHLLNGVKEGIDKAVSMHMLSKLNHIFYSREELLKIIEFAKARNVRINLLNEIPTSKGGNYIEIQQVISIIKELGIKETTLEDDPFSLPVTLFTLINGVRIEIKHLIISDQNLFKSCQTCRVRSQCKEGIYALRLTPNGMISPCLVRNDNQFNALKGGKNELVRYLHGL